MLEFLLIKQDLNANHLDSILKILQLFLTFQNKSLKLNKSILKKVESDHLVFHALLLDLKMEHQNFSKQNHQVPSTNGKQMQLEEMLVH